MPTVTIQGVKRYAKRMLIALASLVALFSGLIAWAWNVRAEIADTGLHPQVVADAPEAAVTATWLGVTTLLFDDGETQILIDGFISRPSLFESLTKRPVTYDAPMINYVMNEYQMRRLAAIIPAHSHYDHAMDAGAIANRSSASILGSETTANIARGAGVPEDQIVVAEAGSPYSFGDFTVTLVPSAHAPIGLRGEVPLAGTVDEPLALPAPITAWREGGSYSIVVSHPQGTTIVQGSAGYKLGALDDVQADVVMLGVGLLENLGRDYTEGYWQALVTSTGATRVFPVHFDDQTRPFGDIALPPKLIDNFVRTAGWLKEIRNTWDKDTRLYLPVFGEPLVLYPEQTPDA
ncbi:MAG: MBL fold metallo-hydrolase [Gammaproteobacteria bacterium]|jgi:L-ascorbate metabolism protein UlaG (beta-lactamase superfamily)|nr:MBL fold metallo-hydrolase [Gammaproteobacteria bacterium]MDH3909069.1 MBL fold metallo-hydrolase [Gammaproteobacteria bacterium]MDH3954658.1 MBL fold metallo-hydrolase [Gammaproteobacteria bacterium]NCF59598.1 MBL fold metallo-hydrolase [Gammaproteobacteria bacterium]